MATYPYTPDEKRFLYPRKHDTMSSSFGSSTYFDTTRRYSDGLESVIGKINSPEPAAKKMIQTAYMTPTPNPDANFVNKGLLDVLLQLERYQQRHGNCMSELEIAYENEKNMCKQDIEHADKKIAQVTEKKAKTSQKYSGVY